MLIPTYMLEPSIYHSREKDLLWMMMICTHYNPYTKRLHRYIYTCNSICNTIPNVNYVILVVEHSQDSVRLACLNAVVAVLHRFFLLELPNQKTCMN